MGLQFSPSRNSKVSKSRQWGSHDPKRHRRRRRKGEKSKDNDDDDDDDSVLFGHIFDILRTTKCKDSCYEIVIGIEGLHTSLCLADFRFATCLDTYI